jgi:pimeloyl-ACP methyl ester carboxylesterase
MARATVNDGIELEYEEIGSPDDPTLLLVMGLGGQLIAWPDAFCAMLADRGNHVVRFDNRDCGLSSKLDGVTIDVGAVMTSALAGQPYADAPYTLTDMASDAAGLLDHLDVDQAHVVGMSMGGMIAQHLAVEHSERVLSLTSVMSTTGEPEYGTPDPEALPLLLAPPPTERTEVLERAAGAFRIIGSKRYADDDAAKELAGRSYDRSFYPEGVSRQLAAVASSGPRTDRLPTIKAPTLVIHGRDDRLVAPSGGQRTAELIPGASLLLVADMGHDLPQPLWPLIVDVITRHTTLATAGA